MRAPFDLSTALDAVQPDRRELLMFLMPGARMRPRPRGLVAVAPLIASGSFLIQPEHNNARIDLTGAFYTVSAGPAGAYPSIFTVTLTNTSTSRAKLISFSGLTSFFLWPSQSMTVYRNNSGAWAMSQPSKWVYTSAPTIFVDPSNGSDTTSADGLATGAGAKASIPAAYTLALQNFVGIGGAVSIQLANGTYSTGLPYTFVGGTGGIFLFSISGAVGQGANVILTKGLSVKDFVAFQFSEMTFSGFNGSAIEVDQNGIVDVASTVTYGQGGSYPNFTPFDAENGGVMNISGATVNASALNLMFYAHARGQINFISPTISIPTAIAMGTSTAYADDNGLIEGAGGTFSGAGVAGTTGQRYLAARGGGIWTGGGANYFPGSVAGSATSPGWYG